MSDDLKHNVLAQIKAGRVHMHSRAYFALRAIGVVGIAVLAFVATAFVASFILFSVHESGVGFLLGYGPQGVATFVTVVPWTLFVLSVGCLVAAAWVWQSRFAYRIPLIEGLMIVFGGATLAAGIVALSPIHGMLLGAADRNQLPLFGPFYEQVHDSHRGQGVFRGVVNSIATSSFVLRHDDTDRDTDDGTWVVMPPPHFDLGQIQTGERLYVAGQEHQGVIRAYGISAYPLEGAPRPPIR